MLVLFHLTRLKGTQVIVRGLKSDLEIMKWVAAILRCFASLLWFISFGRSLWALVSCCHIPSICCLPVIDILFSWSSPSLLLVQTCVWWLTEKYIVSCSTLAYCVFCNCIEDFCYLKHSIKCSIKMTRWRLFHLSRFDSLLFSLQLIISPLCCVWLLQTLVGAWWAHASACLLADPTMSGRRSWSETGSTHRLCATYCCWTTLSRHSKSA